MSQRVSPKSIGRSPLQHALSDDLLHTVITTVVHILHEIHDGGLGIFLALLGPLAAPLRSQVSPAIEAELPLHLAKFDDDFVLLDDKLTAIIIVVVTSGCRDHHVVSTVSWVRGTV